MCQGIFSPYAKYKLFVLGLLTVNIFIYALVDTLNAALDALAWVLLLVSFELEAVKNDFAITEKTLRVVRNVLIAVIALVFVCYVQENEWLEVLNSLLWFALIAILELEVRWTELVLKHKTLVGYATIALFAGLLVMVAIWLLKSAWLDAYDAALWIVAFAVIEVDIFHFLQIRNR